jgi:FKBP-type peptidyl-prolyl cis-trans isomerase
MSAKENGRRIMILVIVGAFVISTVGLSGLVLWDATRSKDDAAVSEELKQQLEEQQGENGMQGQQLEGYNPVANVNQLQVNDLTEGEGAEAKADSTVTAHYTGALAKTGVIFESSKDRGEPATFPLAQVIKGWQEGVPGMKEGGKRRLIIPAELAYGEQGSPPAIGPNEPLVFDIELVSVK